MARGNLEMKTINSCRGFTLVEVLIALAISGLLMTAVYVAFQSQQRSYLAQEQVAEVQQNIRAGVDFMVREIRMAGYDPTGIGNDGIEEATVGRFGFTSDSNADGDVEDTGESITYGFCNTFDSEPDGVVDGGGVASLGRDTGGGFQPVAENIQAIEFNYLDEDGNVTVALDDIRAVQISILARAQRPDRNYLDTRVYPDNGTTPGGVTWGPFDDNFRRRFQTITVKLRNMGI
jgi:type IV pilus assembly protein PilW